MGLPTSIGTRELIKYAKDNGYNSVKFCGGNSKGMVIGRFIDAYYELVEIPACRGGGCFRISDIEELMGYDITFDVLDDEQYRGAVRMDYILHRLTPPEWTEKEETNDGESL